jgi:hypothetical protein
MRSLSMIEGRKNFGKNRTRKLLLIINIRVKRKMEKKNANKKIAWFFTHVKALLLNLS